jgi:hypothetical protein
MNVGEFRKLTKDLPDNTPFLVPKSNHSYRGVTGYETTALYDSGAWTQDYGEDSTPENKYGRRLKVFVVG